MRVYEAGASYVRILCLTVNFKCNGLEKGYVSL